VITNQFDDRRRESPRERRRYSPRQGRKHAADVLAFERACYLSARDAVVRRACVSQKHHNQLKRTGRYARKWKVN
jgi:hypothetical protein